MSIEKRIASEDYVNSAIANIDIGATGNGISICNVESLPTENINSSIFYRIITGSLYYFNTSTQELTLDDSQIIKIVQNLPEIGQEYDENSYHITYYELSTGQVSYWHSENNNYANVTDQCHIVYSLENYENTDDMPIILLSSDSLYHFNGIWNSIANSATVIVNIDRDTKEASLTGKQIIEAIESGKKVFANDGIRTNSTYHYCPVFMGYNGDAVAVRQGNIYGMTQATNTIYTIRKNSKNVIIFEGIGVPIPAFGSPEYDGNTHQVITPEGFELRWKNVIDLLKDYEVVKSPSAAAVGQTIVVKAVDENGKPIEWECVDMVAGGGSDAELPAVTEADNGKILMVVDGVWQAVALPNAEEASF